MKSQYINLASADETNLDCTNILFAYLFLLVIFLWNAMGDQATNMTVISEKERTTSKGIFQRSH